MKQLLQLLTAISIVLTGGCDHRVPAEAATDAISDCSTHGGVHAIEGTMYHTEIEWATETLCNDGLVVYRNQTTGKAQ